MPGKKVESDMMVGLRLLLEEWDEDQRCGRQSAVRDLLTDLRHLCDEERVDFHAAVDGSYQVYIEEKHENTRGNKKRARSSK